jgi:hypothetical protein
MEPLRFRDGDHYFEEHSGRLAPGTQETRIGTSSQPQQGIIATLTSATGGTIRLDPTKLEESVRQARALFRRPITAREIDRWKREGRL